MEDYEQLERSLRNLVSEDIFGRDFMADFRKTALGLSSIGNVLVGHLARKRSSFAAVPQGILPDLPTEVEGITVHLHKILSSGFALTFDVKLTDSAAERLRALQVQDCLPKIRFRHWIPWGEGAGSHSESTAESARQELVVGWLLELRRRIEAALLRRIFGYFSVEHHGSSPCLPAFEIFSLRRVPTDDKGFSQWLNLGSGWLGTLGATRVMVDWYGFKCDDLVLILPGQIDAKIAAYRVFSLIGTAVDQQAEQHRHLVLQEKLDRALAVFVVTEFLDRTQETVEELRKEVYERLKEKPRPGRLRRDLKLNQKVERASLLLSRFKMEMEQEEEWLKRYLLWATTFHRLGGTAKSKGQQLSEVLLNGIRAQTHVIRNHQRLISELFASHLSWRNLDANYRLQRQMLVWTVAVSLATLAANN